MCASSKAKLGDHYIGLYCYKAKKDKIWVYFDSLGGKKNCIVSNVLSFIKSRCKNVVYNGRQIQSVETNVCGLYCILFLHCIQTIKFSDLFKMFYFLSILKNDKMVFNVFKMHKTS
jgi:hypothetical protein